MMMRKQLDKILELTCRYYVFFFLNFYGIGKIMGGQFYRKGRLPEEVAAQPLGNASAYDLAWSFMGYSFSYILFIGATQILGAWLLLFHRTKILGVMILSPIMINIIVFDIIFLEVKDALVNAIIYFLMMLYILYYNRNMIMTALEAITSQNKTHAKAPSRYRQIVLVALMTFIVFMIDQGLVTLVRSRF